MSPQEQPEVGTLAEEAERLAAAVSGWARSHDAGAAADVQGGPSGDCRWCPVCRGAGMVRHLDPEVRGHLLVAATSLVQAAAAALETMAPEAQEQRGVERIDLDTQEWEDE